MRITQSSVYIPYQRNLEEINTRLFKEQMRLNTGEYLTEMSDSAERFVNVKELNDRISRNETHVNVLEDVFGELTIVNDQLQHIADKFSQIRELAIDGTQTSNMGNLFTIGVYVKGLLEDIVREANYEFNGKYVFAGTKTTAESLNKTAEAQNDLPFEIVEGDATEDNPSGLRVVFKGNFKERIINKDSYSTEVINTSADNLFGNGGVEVFEAIIDLYNLFTYSSDGSQRDTTDLFSKVELGKLNQYQKRIGEIYQSVTNVTSQNGSLMNRLEAFRNQIEMENTNLSEIRSQDADTDVTKSMMELVKQQNSLQYALQIGSRLIPQSLFDFLT